MDDGVADELERLRARAYGPDADIDRDPAARDRLAELEEYARRPAVTESDTPAPQPGVLIDSVPGPETPPSDPVTDTDASSQPDAAPAARPERRSRWVLRATWAASLIGAVALAVAATTAVTVPLTPISPLPSEVEARQVATLYVDSDFVVPDSLTGGGVSGYGFQTFAGLRPVYSEDGWGDPTADVCLALVDDAKLDPDAEFFQGSLYGACGAHPFPAIVSMRVTEDLPQELQDRFPLGTPLQFVLDGSRIAVFVAD